MVSMLVVVGIEMFFASKGAGHTHGDAFPVEEETEDTGGMRPLTRPKRSHSFRGFKQHRGDDHLGPPDITLGTLPEETQNLIDGRSPAINNNTPLSDRPNGHPDSDDESDLELDLDELEQSPSRSSNGHLNGSASHQRIYARLNGPTSHDSSAGLSQSQSQSAGDASLNHALQQKLLLQCLLLEAGILFHSIFIGMALSVATGSTFIVFLIAISFHQTFEGFALGARIAAITFPVGSFRPWLMALAYGTTTPIGQAIGLAIHRLYDPASQTGLLTVGTMNAISSGLLLYAGLVNLLAEDFLSDESYKTLRGRRRLEACGAVVGGAALMALVGAWA
jgi:solute carrier family 39 (zinc transporter), member 1/2/3